MASDRTPGFKPAASSKQTAVHHVSSKHRRSAITHIACVTDEDALQPELPQCFLGNCHVFKKAVITQLQKEAPSNVRLWREQSSWNTTDTMVRFLIALAPVLQPWLPTRQPILLLDMALCHIGPAITEAASRAQIWLLPIPTHLTFILQPLDAHVFLSYKRFWRKAYHRMKMSAGRGVVSDLCWGRLFFQMATFLCSKSWGAAFREDCALGEKVSARLLQALRPATEEQVKSLPKTLPSNDELRSVFPSNRRIDLSAYFRPLAKTAGYLQTSEQPRKRSKRMAKATAKYSVDSHGTALLPTEAGRQYSVQAI